MTRREWLVEHVPENVMKVYGGSAESKFEGGCCGCPWEYEELPGTEKLCDPEQSCETCWTRELPEPRDKKENQLETARRAVNIASRIMSAAEMCMLENRERCIKDRVSVKTCDKCIEVWLMAKARRELRREHNAEILSDLKDID